jgi:hypothetical protein
MHSFNYFLCINERMFINLNAKLTSGILEKNALTPPPIFIKVDRYLILSYAEVEFLRLGA